MLVRFPLEEIKYLIFPFFSLWFRGKVWRWDPPLNTLCLLIWRKVHNRIVLTLGSLCLLCSATLKKWLKKQYCIIYSYYTPNSWGISRRLYKVQTRIKYTCNLLTSYSKANVCKIHYPAGPALLKTIRIKKNCCFIILVHTLFEFPCILI